jgi:hypothetical protein
VDLSATAYQVPADLVDWGQITPTLTTEITPTVQFAPGASTTATPIGTAPVNTPITGPGTLNRPRFGAASF